MKLNFNSVLYRDTIRYLLFVWGCFLLSFSVLTQPNFPVNGVHDSEDKYYAFTHATIVSAPEKFFFNGTMLIKGSTIVAVGNDVSIPEGAVVFDVKGKFIYPSFIELYAGYGVPDKLVRKKVTGPQYNRSKEGLGGWNDAFHPEIEAADFFQIDKKQAKEWRTAGFGVVNTHLMDGIARGTGAVVELKDDGANKVVIRKGGSSYYSFHKGSSKQKYPGSLMGAIALIRQNHYDAQWYEQHKEKEFIDLSLEALIKEKESPRIFAVKDYQSVLRADRIGDEFGVQFIVKGNGDEYRRVDLMRSSQASFIVPLVFPDAYDVKDPFDAMYLSTEKMKHWEMAPANPAVLSHAGIPIAFTTDGLKKKTDILKNVRKAIEYGLPEAQALEALTMAPAKMIQMDHVLGSLDVGKRANFLITSGPIFEEDVVIYENWVGGTAHLFKDKSVPLISGVYNLNVDGNLFQLVVEEKEGKQKAKITYDKKEVKASLEQQAGLVTLVVQEELGSFKTPLRFSGKVNFAGKIWDGKALDPEGKWYDWSAIRAEENKKDLTKTTTSQSVNSVVYPNNGYGSKEIPIAENWFIDNIFIWTSDSAGSFTGDVIVKNGKIEQVGKNLENKDGFQVINGKGKHLTPGIIDEHSHIAISGGVNEGTQSSSAEVRIGDVVDADDINIYRQLAGGVTAVQLLHGSANPIGGQSAIVKLKWGYDAEMMKIQGAPGFIKFALGENVKQSNWGDAEKVRFPQTRMGVEQVFYDAFIRAKEYKLARANYDEEESRLKLPLISKPNPYLLPRRDLELDAIAEILDSTRFISCHSYVQSEINMLMHVADSMKFTVNTFTHILEGYKLADKLKKHGAAGSTFADWWAYKFEVNDAIPYNAALLHKMGVLTGINSDDPEMGRRLNQEAAKTVKYGEVPEEEAIKMITINPARMLHIDHRTGSIAPGKDADLVIWDHHPLSVYAQPEMTMIEGTVFYSSEKDKELRSANSVERARLIKKMLKAAENGAKTKSVEKDKHKHYHCDTIEEEITY